MNARKLILWQFFSVVFLFTGKKKPEVLCTMENNHWKSDFLLQEKQNV